MAANVQAIMSILSALSQPSTTQQGRTGLQSLFSFEEGGGGGGLVGGSGFAGKDTYTDKKYGIAQNIFDPAGITGFWGSKKKKKETPSIEDIMDRMKAWERAQPEYQAYMGALEGISPETGYGVIQPDWGEVLDRGVSKIQQVYKGGPTSTGVLDKIRADVAARNVGDSPALGRQMLQAGAQEAMDIGDLSFRTGEAERQLKEAGRRDWLNRLQSLAGYGATPPDLSQLFALDALQTPMQPQADYSGIGTMLSNIMGGRIGGGATQAVPTSQAYAGNTSFGNLSMRQPQTSGFLSAQDVEPRTGIGQYNF